VRHFSFQHLTRETCLSTRLIEIIHFKCFTHDLTSKFLKFFSTRFEQYDHYYAFKLIVEESAFILLSWLWLLMVHSMRMRIRK
jgi:hypothetical protein